MILIYKCKTCDGKGFHYNNQKTVAGALGVDYYVESRGPKFTEEDCEKLLEEANKWIDDNWEDFMDEAMNDPNVYCLVCKGEGYVDWITNCIRR